MLRTVPVAETMVRCVVVTLWLAGCGGAEKAVKECKPSKTARITLAPSDRLNPDDQGRALPTVVRLYQLTDLARLETAEFEDIWQRASETLEKDLVKHDEITLYPTKAVTKEVELGADVKFVVAVGLFRNPAGISWRDIWQIPAPVCKDDKPIPPTARFELEDYRVELVVQRKKKGPAGTKKP